MRYLALVPFMLVGGCQQNAAVAACETFVKERLRSPSTYKQIKADFSGVAFESEGRNVKMVGLEYDAANAYGTPIRGDQQCLFEVDKSGKFVVKDLQHSARMASIGADSEYAPCCIIDQKVPLSTDPVEAVDQAEAMAQAAVKAADEALEAGRK